jgi:glyoxylase-like metal-dependent hydrolase (beta-lactamase superfamily II)
MNSPPVPNNKGENKIEENFPRFRSLIQYLASTQRVLELELDLILPGHGEPIVDHRRLILDLKNFYQNRQNKILEILGEQELSPFEITQQLFPQVSTFEILLAVSEVVGNVEVLEEEGKVEQGIKNQRIYCRRK